MKANLSRKASYFIYSVCIVLLSQIISCIPHYGCSISINETFVKNSCGLNNGVFIEKLENIKLDSNGLPNEFLVTQRIECSTPDDSAFLKPKDKIFFKERNQFYLWRVDTVSFHFRIVGHYRERILPDSVKPHYYTIVEKDTVEHEGVLDGLYVSSADSYPICPVDFQENSWYLIHFYDHHFAFVFIFVENKKSFKIHEIESGISPI